MSFLEWLFGTEKRHLQQREKESVYNWNKLIFPKSISDELFSKRGNKLEELGYILAVEIPKHDFYAFAIKKSCVGSSVLCGSEEEDNLTNAINKLIEEFPELVPIPYHNHPLEGPSIEDVSSMIESYCADPAGRIRNFVFIGPRTIEIRRLFELEDGRYETLSLVGTRLLEIKTSAIHPRTQEYEKRLAELLKHYT